MWSSARRQAARRQAVREIRTEAEGFSVWRGGDNRCVPPGIATRPRPRLALTRMMRSICPARFEAELGITVRLGSNFETPIRDPEEVQQVQHLKDCKRVLRSEENSVRYLPQRPTLPRKPSPLATLRHYYRCWLSRRSTCVSSAAVASRARRYLCDRRDRRGWLARRDRGPDGLVTPTQGVGLAGRPDPNRSAPSTIARSPLSAVGSRLSAS